MGNPFIDKSNKILVLDTRDVDTLAVDAVRSLKIAGQEQYNTFVTERLVEQKTPVIKGYDILKLTCIED